MLIIICHWIVLIRPSIPSHPIIPTVPLVLYDVSTHGRPKWSSVLNHDLEIELINPHHFFPNHFNILRVIVKPESSWNEKNPKLVTNSLLWPFWCVLHVPKAVLMFLLQCPTL
ncbi:Uncharacterized protein Rs2_44249 [Raphanus sativus]|nr:Uncharacterized protein Rs2_44249 [Raphanus sativus]